MTISAHVDEWLGFRVRDFDPEGAVPAQPGVMSRLSLSYEQAEGGVTLSEIFERYLAQPAAAAATGLVIGAWGWESMMDSKGAEELVRALTAARNQLPRLEALFFGDITFEECEASWIVQTDLTRLLNAYPGLRHFRVRGGNGLRFSNLTHAVLQSLVIETGGLPAEVLTDVAHAELPQLEYLELWLGSANYGGISDTGPLEPLLKARRFPKLGYLGLRNSELADAVAQVVVDSPVLDGLAILDLSLGTLGDEGAKHLAASPKVRRLKKLDLHHNYLSEAMKDQLARPGVEVDVSDTKEEDVYGDERYRYNALSE
jgi:hypothetical protein